MVRSLRIWWTRREAFFFSVFTNGQARGAAEGRSHDEANWPLALTTARELFLHTK